MAHRSNKTHKQKYFKKENFKVDKKNLQIVTGNRTELAPYEGQEFLCECFITNSYSNSSMYRVVSEVRIPDTDLYVSHVNCRSENLELAEAGYAKLKMRVKSYKNQITNVTRYGLSCIDTRFKSKTSTKVVKPKWMSDEEFKTSSVEKVTPEIKKIVKQPFRKLRKVRKV